MQLEKNELQFLSLLRLGLSSEREIPQSLFSKIDWNKIFEISKKQTLVGIIFDAITKLPQELRPEKPLFIQWYAMTNFIEKQNKLIDTRIKEVVSKYQDKGVETVLLKGQGLAQYYPIPHHRQPGDIDLYFFDKYDKANEIAKEWEGVTFLPDTSYHRAFMYNGCEVENHLQYVDFYCKKNKKRWKTVENKIPLIDKETLSIGDHSVQIPQPQMNVVYTFLHIMHHMLQVGVGLRQICDLACLWRATHNRIDKELFLWSIDQLKARRAMTAVAYIMEEYLDLQKGIIPLETTNSQAKKDGEFILRDILKVGNFGQHTSIMQRFERNNHIKNFRSYILAFKRQLTLLHIYPSEVIAYPIEWIKSKFKGE